MRATLRVPCPGRGIDITTGTTGCYHFASVGNFKESPAITSYFAVSSIASAPADFYNQPTTSVLDAAFASIATDIGSGSSRLVTDGF
jgi:hypothetical protein